MSATADRYAGLAASIQSAGQAEIDREDVRAGRLLRSLNTQCAEQLIDATVTFIGGGRVRVTLYGVDWDLSIQEMGADPADALDKALDALNRKGRS